MDIRARVSTLTDSAHKRALEMSAGGCCGRPGLGYPCDSSRTPTLLYNGRFTSPQPRSNQGVWSQLVQAGQGAGRQAARSRRRPPPHTRPRPLPGEEGRPFTMTFTHRTLLHVSPQVTAGCPPLPPWLNVLPGGQHAGKAWGGLESPWKAEHARSHLSPARRLQADHGLPRAPLATPSPPLPSPGSLGAGRRFMNQTLRDARCGTRLPHHGCR